MKTINWNLVKDPSSEGKTFKDDNGTEFLFSKIAPCLTFTSEDGQDSEDFWILQEGTLRRNWKDYFCFSEINLKDALLYAIEDTDIDSISNQMKNYIEEYLRD